MRKVLPLILTWGLFLAMLTGSSLAEASQGSLNKWMHKLPEEKQEQLIEHLLKKIKQECSIKYMQEIGTHRGHVYLSVLCTNGNAYMFRTTSSPVGVWPCSYFEHKSKGEVMCFKPLPTDERNSC